jgi:hypothetical protein
MVVAAERVAAFSFVRRPSHPALVFGSLKLMSALGHKRTFAVGAAPRIARRVPRLRAALANSASAAFFQSAFGNAIEHHWRRRRSALARPMAVYLLQPFQ